MKIESGSSHPCDDGCQYSKDIGMWPEHSCGNGCVYEKEPALSKRDDTEIYDVVHLS